MLCRVKEEVRSLEEVKEGEDRGLMNRFVHRDEGFA
jgi:hypothetical protein